LPTKQLDDLARAFDAFAVSPSLRSWITERATPRVAIHGDLHFHNMVLSPEGDIIGVFDFGDAHLDSPEQDFHYAHSLGPRFLSLAMEAYGPLDEAHIRRAHLRTALEHFQYHGPGTPRHESIIAWVKAALVSLT
jgi:aminoglycoside phosphotransferase (APT) family kinase protein